MAVSIVQSKFNDSSTTAVASLAVTFDSAVTAGNAILVIAALYDTSGTMTVSDGTNTYTDIINGAVNGGYTGYAWYDHTAAGGSTTITVTPSANKILRLVALELSGHEASASFDDARNNANYSTSTPSAAGITTVSAGRAFAFITTQSGYSVSSWTSPWTQVGAAQSRFVLGSTQTTATTSYTPQLTFAASEVGLILCVNVAEAAGGGGGGGTRRTHAGIIV